MKYFVLLSLFATVGFAYPQFSEYQRTPLGDAVDKASMRILKETFDSAADKNVVASPLGVLTLLSMFSAGTEGDSRQEIMQLLGSTDTKQLEESYGKLIERFSAMDPSYFALANKMYVSNLYTLEEHFSDVASRSFKCEVEGVDFSHRNTTVDSINKWANEKTKGHIKSPVDEQSIDEATAVALFNVIFFQGHWHVPFTARETKEKKFYVSKSQSVKKPMMKLQRSLLYTEDEKIRAKMVELPYKESGFRMVIVLPDKKDGLAEVVNKLAQKGVLDNVFSLGPMDREIAFEMPKFEIKNSLDLKELLPKVGVSRMFSEGTGGVIREKPLAVSKASQEAFVKVDEEGATAGAFTGFIMETRSSIMDSLPPLPFKVDHPFLFVILHDDIVLFTGTYTH